MKSITAIALSWMMFCGAANAQVYGTQNTSSSVLQSHLAASQSISDNTATVVKFDTVDIDTQSGYSATTGRYTPTRAGTYLVCGTVQGLVTTAMTSLTIFVSKNGLQQAGSPRAVSGPLAAAGSSSNSVTMCRNVSLNGTTDTIEIDGTIVGTGGGDSFIGSTVPFTTVSITYLGT